MRVLSGERCCRRGLPPLDRVRRLLGATALLFQCPSSFPPDEVSIARLRSFFRRIDRPAGLRLLWEPRGSRWVAERETARALCAELDIVHVIDPFVTPPPASGGEPVYWRLHGLGGARHSYTDSELRRLHGMVLASHGGGQAGPDYVLFNNLPRAGDARRFAALVG